MTDQTRNLHPTSEAIFAMYHWHTEYAAQHGGSMDFYDRLTKDQKEYCKRAVEAIGARTQLIQAVRDLDEKCHRYPMLHPDGDEHHEFNDGYYKAMQDALELIEGKE